MPLPRTASGLYGRVCVYRPSHPPKHSAMRRQEDGRVTNQSVQLNPLAVSHCCCGDSSYLVSFRREVSRCKYPPTFLRARQRNYIRKTKSNNNTTRHANLETVLYCHCGRCRGVVVGLTAAHVFHRLGMDFILPKKSSAIILTHSTMLAL